MEIKPLVLEKMFEVFFTIYEFGSHLCYVTNIILMNFHFLIPKSLHTKFGKNGPIVSEKSNV